MSRLRGALMAWAMSFVLAACGGGESSSPTAVTASGADGASVSYDIDADADADADTAADAGATLNASTVRVATDSSQTRPLPEGFVAVGHVVAFTPFGLTARDIELRVPFDARAAGTATPRLLVAMPNQAWTEVASASVDGAAMVARVPQLSHAVVVVGDDGRRAPVRSMALADWDSGVSWISCSVEWRTCVLPSTGTNAVRYGRDASTPGGSVTREYTGVASVACTNAVFGDPSPGFVKRCYYGVADGGVAVTPAITAQPQSTSVVVGQTANFTMGFTGGGVVDIQWQYRAAADADPEAGWSNVTNNGAAQNYVTSTVNASNHGRQYRAIVASAAGTAKTQPANLLVTGGAVAPTITVPPAPITVAAGGEANFAAQATGTAPLSWVWLRDGVTINGANAPTYRFTTTAADHGAQFSVRVANSAGTVTSTPVVLTVTSQPVAPTIVTPPGSLTVEAGTTAVFSVAAQGTAPLTYQWFRNGVAVAGATASQLQVTTTAADAGTTSSVTVRVSNDAGTITSAAAVLTVVAPVPTAPSIVTPPAPVSVPAGLSATFAVTAQGTAPLAYQWLRNGVAVAGATTAQLDLPTTAADAGTTAQITVRVSNGVGTVTSAPAVLTVTAAPAGVTWILCAEEWQTCRLPTSGANTVRYGRDTSTPGWSVSRDFTGVSTVACTNALFGDPTPGFGKRCWYAVPDSGTPVAPSFVTSPSPVTVEAGTTATFTAEAQGTAPLAYQWLRNGVVITGATAAQLQLATAAAEAGTTAQIAVRVTNVAGSVTSAPAVLTITAPATGVTWVACANEWQTCRLPATGTYTVRYGRDATTPGWYVTREFIGVSSVACTNTVFGDPTPGFAKRCFYAVPDTTTVAPSVVTPPSSTSVVAGTTASFAVVAQGTAPLAYQWRRDGAAIVGATGAQLQLPTTAVEAGTTSQITVQVSNSAGSVTSAPAVLTVTAPVVAPSIVTPPASASVQAGTTAIFGVAAQGSAPLAYQWFRDSVAITGATTAQLQVPTTAADVGVPSQITVRVTNSAGSVTSAAAMLTVTAAIVAPTILTQPVSTSVQAGETAVFGLTAQGSAPLVYQWFRNGVEIAGATSVTLLVETTSADIGQSIALSVRVSNAAGTVTSGAATLTVTPVVVSSAVKFLAPSGAGASLATVSSDGLTVNFAGTAAVGVKANSALTPAGGFRYFEATRVGMGSVSLGVSSSAPQVPPLADGGWVATRDSVIVDEWLIVSTDVVYGVRAVSAAGGGSTFGIAVDHRQKYPVAYVISRAGDNPGACGGLGADEPCVYRRVQLSDTTGSLAIYAFNKGDGAPATSVSINAGGDLVAKPFAYPIDGVHRALRAARFEGSTGLDATWPLLSADAAGPTLEASTHTRLVIRQGDIAPVRAGFAVTTTAAPGSVVRWTDETSGRTLLGTGASLTLASTDIALMTPGEHRVVASVADATTGRYTERLFTLTVLPGTGNGDDDGDALSYDQEKLLGTDPANPDSDSDGLADGAEAGLGTSPVLADTNGNGVADGLEFPNTAQQPVVGAFVREAGTGGGVFIAADGQRAAFGEDVNPDCARNLPPFTDPVYSIEICRKRAVRTNAAVRAGEFRYFETRRLSVPENMGHGVTTRTAAIDPFCCAADGALHPLTPPSLQFNSVLGQVLINLVNQPPSMANGADRDQTVVQGFVVDYRGGTNPDIYMVMTNAAGQMVVTEKYALTGFGGADVVPYAYAHPLSDIDPRVEINLGLRAFHYATPAIAAALDAQGVSTQGFTPGVGLHRWAPAQAPVIATPPGALSVEAGITAVFNVAATGSAPLAYQWFRDGVAVAGGDTSRLEMATSAADVGTTSQITVRVSNAVGSVTSASAVLTVTAPSIAPTIVGQPTPVDIVAGGTAVFTVSAQGTSPLSYQWFRDSVAITGATTSQLELVTVAADAGTSSAITVRVSNPAGGVTSAVALLNVTAPLVAPSLVNPLGALSVEAGVTAVFNVAAQGTAPLSYQWSRDGVAVAGATGAQLQVPTSAADAGTSAQITVQVSNPAGSVTSPPAVLTITAPLPVAPQILAQPASVNVEAGATTVFSVTVQGTAPFAYQWFKDGAAITNATAAQLSLHTRTADLGTSAQITVTVSNAAGAVTSNAAVMTVTSVNAVVYPWLNIGNGGVPIENGVYTPGHYAFSSAPRAVVPGVDPAIEIRGRGNTTWYGSDKKPYRLKLGSSATMLGMPSNRHWVLLANHFDKTLLRNELAFEMSRRAGMAWTPRSQYTYLNLNAEFVDPLVQGGSLYALVEHVRGGSNRVNIPSMSISNTTEPTISGGYLIELDEDAVGQPGCFQTTRLTMNFCVAEPDSISTPGWEPQWGYVTSYVQQAEDALFGANFADPVEGYAKYLDVDSVIQYYLVNELTKNIDGDLRRSTFMYKQRSGKLFFGPVWDFDLAMGNVSYEQFVGPEGWHIRNAPWYSRLFEDPAFRAKVVAKWNAMKASGAIDGLLDYLDYRSAQIQIGQQQNFTRWPVWDVQLFVEPFPLPVDHADAVSRLRGWVGSRIQWMDAQITQLQ